jgi:hypothetical protein
MIFKDSVLKSSVLEGLNGPPTRKPIEKSGGAKPPTFFDWLPGRRRPCRPTETDDSRTEFLQIRNYDLDSGPDFRFEFSRCLRIDPPGQFSLIYVACFKPGPLGSLLGPTLAENLPKTKKT